MSELSQADRFLLDEIKNGNSEGWSQLVQRYEGRLVAFARQQLSNAADAEDVVQETFLSLLTGLDRFRQDAGLETYLFGILRRRIVDQIRSRGRAERLNLCSLQDRLPRLEGGREVTLETRLPAAAPSASWHARREEDQSLQHQALCHAVQQFTQRLKDSLNFRDLEIGDLVFYAQLRNKDIASLMEMDEKQVALLKHRFVKRISEHLREAQCQRAGSAGELAPDESLLTQVWETQRPSCPKRTTIGKYMLGTLELPWHRYIQFHLETLGCRFCRANLDDLNAQTRSPERRATCERIIQSTIGFFQKS